MRPSLSLSIEIESADGSLFTLDSDAHRKEQRPQGLSWKTQRGDGFADGSLTLRRSVLRDWDDLALLNPVTIYGADGAIAWEGRIGGIARETGDGHSISVPLQGWMAHAKDTRFREVYVDRDAGRWVNQPSFARQAALLAGASKYKLAAGQTDTVPAPDGAGSAVALSFDRVAKSGSFFPLAECWYDAAGIDLAEIGSTYSDKVASTDAGLSSTYWSSRLFLATDDVASAIDLSANLAGTSGAVSVEASGSRKYAVMQLAYTGDDIAADGSWTAWHSTPYVVGAHGLELSAGGLTVAEMIRDSAQRFAPLLDTSGVRDTSYPIQHAAPTDPTYPYDFWLDLNKAHLWELSVWEGRKLYFEPPSTLDDYDWEVRTDDPGVRLSFGGDTVTDLANGADVGFTDIATGKQRRITPADYSELADSDPANPANRVGIDKWLPYDIPFPCHEDDAVQYGRAWLSEAIRAKSPVSIQAGYYVRDRAGNRQPAWKVRAGQRIAITDHPNDAPRRIIDTSYTHDGRGLTISADRASAQLSAVVDRISLARTAAGL